MVGNSTPGSIYPDKTIIQRHTHPYVHCNTTVTKRKQTKCSLTYVWVKMSYIYIYILYDIIYIIYMPLSICHCIYTYIRQNYSVLKKNEIISFEATWVNLDLIILREVSQREKDKYHIL